jgi:hypothetical protein
MSTVDIQFSRNECYVACSSYVLCQQCKCWAQLMTCSLLQQLYIVSTVRTLGLGTHMAPVKCHPYLSRKWKVFCSCFNIYKGLWKINIQALMYLLFLLSSDLIWCYVSSVVEIRHHVILTISLASSLLLHSSARLWWSKDEQTFEINSDVLIPNLDVTILYIITVLFYVSCVLNFEPEQNASSFCIFCFVFCIIFCNLRMCFFSEWKFRFIHTTVLFDTVWFWHLACK